MSIISEYPYCRQIIESGYAPLLSTSEKAALYVRSHNDLYVFENPIFTTEPKMKNDNDKNVIGASMSHKDFLASIPTFADFSDNELEVLQEKVVMKTFAVGDVIFKQGDEGDMFYVVKKGVVDVLIQESVQLLRRGDLGKKVNRLTEGCYFGERALMTAEPRAASIKVIQETTCLVFSRAVYEEIISGSNALIGQDANVTVDWSTDHETRSLFRHIENILDIDKMDASPKIKRVSYELSTAFTPELSVDEVISRMVMTVKIALKADRVGLFVLSEDKRSMVLKVMKK
jgi:CRP-like cAMP-binding protein